MVFIVFKADLISFKGSIFGFCCD